MESFVKVSTCNLNQWALDFDGNLHRIMQSIHIAKQAGSRLRIGPELEVCGYGCEDHFLEQDTFYHCWQSLAMLLSSDITRGIICDIGMPVLHKSVRYNCRVLLLDRKILLIRPKIDLANDGNYREMRWFTPWSRGLETEEYLLPRAIQKITNQVYVPFGNAILQCHDAAIASETCEELFTPQSPHISLALDGVEIFTNGSGSHHNLAKLKQRLDLINSATAKAGGLYLYANQQGCDGGRLYYDGCCMISLNGKLIARGSQFSAKDVEVVSAVVDLDEVRSFRGSISSRSIQAAKSHVFPRIHVDFDLICSLLQEQPSVEIDPNIPSKAEEIAFGPSCWLWDYLRRSGASGFFLPLSGGADSSSTAALVGIMTQTVYREIANGDKDILKDLREIVHDSEYFPNSPKEICEKIFHTCYMGTENSSAETRQRAKSLSSDIGSYHLDVNIDSLVSSMTSLFTTITGKLPRFRANGGTRAENLALQNIQARLRMVLSFFLAQLLPWVRGQEGFLLVLGSANVDEALRGYMTKYDCSSADINPIGELLRMI